VWSIGGTGGIGCRLPTSADGTNASLSKGYIIDTYGGYWVATCGVLKKGDGSPTDGDHDNAICPPHSRSSTVSGVVLRNGQRVGSGLSGCCTIVSMPDPDQDPLNLRFCGGEVYMQPRYYPVDVAVHFLNRWQGLSTYLWATTNWDGTPFAEGNFTYCGNGGTPPSNAKRRARRGFK
jgi:hypothetical protein